MSIFNHYSNENLDAKDGSGSIVISDDLFKLLLKLGMFALSKGKASEALSMLGLVYSLDRDTEAGCIANLHVLRLRGMFPEMHRFFAEVVLKKYPEKESLLLQYALCILDDQKIKESKTMLKELLKSDDDVIVAAAKSVLENVEKL